MAIKAYPAFAQDLPQAQDEYQRLLPPEAYDPENIPEEWVEEALQFNNYCNATHKVNKFHNCDCLSMRYLDKRIEGGYDATPNGIMLSLEGECMDTTKAAGHMRTRCYANVNMMPNIDDPDEYCDCVGNEYAKHFENNKIRPSSKSMVRIQSMMMSRCAAMQNRQTAN